ncbi:cytochrome P450 9e2-like [Aricia agestis]|uniref:cytochrome P450 9e2-like n=1 Tax=Aricia agestis TaxID=91739 RepID=UPI001C201A69|nr:cytochrome P450 9e2-like [Aricia agestis]
MFVTLLAVTISTILIYVIYKYKAAHNYFEKHGLKYKAGIPVFGNSCKSTFYKRHTFEDIDEIYRAFPDEKYVGYLEAMKPVIIIRDPEIIKEITVKQFDHFVDHRQLFSPEIEPLIGGSLFLMKVHHFVDHWQQLFSPEIESRDPVRWQPVV